MKEKIIPSAEEIEAMHERIQENKYEDIRFADKVDDAIAHKLPVQEVVEVGKTPNVLRLVNSESQMLLINQSTIRNCFNSENVMAHGHTSGHDLPLSAIKQLPEAIRNPIMICSGSHSNSVVVITELKNKGDKNIVVPIAIDLQKEGSIINKVLSAYGKDNIELLIDKGILAVNKEKAKELGWDIEADSSQSALIPCFDNSIAYSMENVKTFSKNILSQTRFNDAMTMTEMLDRYSELEKEMRYINYNNLSDSDRENLKEYAEIKSFIRDRENSVDFLLNSTAMTRDDNGKMSVRSMISKEEYAESLDVLTNGFDKNFIEAIQSEQYKTLSYNERVERLAMNKALFESVMTSAEIALEIEKYDKREYTVGEMKAALENAEKLMLKNEIDKENTYEETAEKFSQMYDENRLKVIDTIEKERTEKEEKSVTIIESNDGYVMNTSEKITSENIKEFSEKSNIENVNEVHQDIPKETTNSKADVRPNVKLEQAKDIGTKEQAEIDSGYGTDNDIEIAARNSKVYETQTEKASIQPKTKRDNGIER